MTGVTKIVTLAEHIEYCHAIRAYCDRRGCGYHAELDLEVLVRRLGPDHSAMASKLIPHLRCSRCGSRQVSLIVSPQTGYRPRSS
jgi:hypothetical protein